LGDRGDGYNVVQIVYDGSGGNTGSWSVPVGISSIEVLVIGGGGARRAGAVRSAQPGGSPGGGAGGLYYTTSWGVTGGSNISLAVGIGAPTTTANGAGATAWNSVFGTIIAYGGQGGNTSTNQGGNQGGYSIDNGSNITPDSSVGPEMAPRAVLERVAVAGMVVSIPAYGGAPGVT
jgi:hypothetical protein